MGFTLGRHPPALLRDRLALDRLHSAEQLATVRSGSFARACGLVTVRQWPGTANGVPFMTLEDETGQVNVILSPGLLEKFPKEALGAALLAVYGVWQAEGKVRHLIASTLWALRKDVFGTIYKSMTWTSFLRRSHAHRLKKGVLGHGNSQKSCPWKHRLPPFAHSVGTER